MRLITNEFLEKVKDVGRHDRDPRSIILAKFEDVYNEIAWYITDYNEDGGMFYGFQISKDDARWGAWSTSYFNEPMPSGATVERDETFKEVKFSELQARGFN